MEEKLIVKGVVKFMGIELPETCKVDWCNKKIFCKGYCKKHYEQIRINGKIKRTSYDPNEIIVYDNYAEIILTNKSSEEVGRCIIDIEDIDKIKNFRWCKTSENYVMSKIEGKSVQIHRLILNLNEKCNFSTNLVDHINHNKLDNRKNNLRICTNSENQRNRKSKGYRKTLSNKYEVWIKVNDKIMTRTVDTEEEAIELRKTWEMNFFKEFRYDDCIK